MTTLAIRSFDLPWTAEDAVEARFRRILRNTALLLLLLSVLVPWLPVFERSADEAPKVPPRYARMVLARQPPPPPAVAATEPELEPVPVEDTVEPVPAPVAKASEPVPAAPAPAPQPSAREKAAGAGVMAFADALADLRENTAVAAALGAGLSAGAGETRHHERNLVTAAGGRASGGINTAGLSRDTGGAGVGDRQVTGVSSPLAGSGGNGRGAAAAGPGKGDGGAAARSREEIELVFDRNKAAIYALYNRALRSDPTLRGRMVLKLTIAPSGEVTDCEVVASEIGDQEFARRLVARVKLFRFEAKDVATVTTTKPIEFFPA